MDPRTGELYKLEGIGDPGDVVTASEAKAADEETVEKLKALMEEDRERQLVALGDRAAQKVALAERELRRRAARR